MTRALDPVSQGLGSWLDEAKVFGISKALASHRARPIGTESLTQMNVDGLQLGIGQHFFETLLSAQPRIFTATEGDTRIVIT